MLELFKTKKSVALICAVSLLLSSIIAAIPLTASADKNAESTPEIWGGKNGLDVAAVEYAGDRVALVLAQGNFRVHTGERQVRAVVLSRFGAVEKLIVFGHQRLTAVSVFPQPVLEGVLNDLLLLLGEGRFFHI